MTFLDRLRQENPLIICITNDVVKNFTANGLVALGASPAMSEWPEDLEDLLPHAGALLINIGTLTDETWQLYKAALTIAERHGVPAVLDPVAVSAGPYRQKVVADLLANHRIAVVRGNAGEIACLGGQVVTSKGVDSAAVDDIAAIARATHHALSIPIVATGQTDAVAAGERVATLTNGSAQMPLVIGTGCLLGAVLAGFVAVADADERFDALVEGLAVYNIAGEMAEREIGAVKPGSFQVAFLNALHDISAAEVREAMQVTYG